MSGAAKVKSEDKADRARQKQAAPQSTAKAADSKEVATRGGGGARPGAALLLQHSYADQGW